MRIVVFGDSLVMPRPFLPEPHQTAYEDVYAWRVRDALSTEHETEVCYLGGLDTLDAIGWSEQIVAYKSPDLVIFHIGINDCVPRMFKKNSRSILLRPFFRKLTHDLALRVLRKIRYPITKYAPKTYVSKPDFRRNWEKMMADVRRFNPRARFMAIGIAKSPERMERRSHGINRNVIEYNAILADIFGDGYIEVNDLLPNSELLVDDGVHLTRKAHGLIATRLVDEIKKMALRS